MTETAPFPVRGVLIGVDHGTKRIGLAVSDPDQKWAMPLDTWQVLPRSEAGKSFLRVAAQYRAVGWVVGLPLRMTGDEGTQAAVVREFGEWLQQATNLPVTYWDERLSSAAAEALLWTQGQSPRQSKGRVDELAAKVILQAYLDAANRPPLPPTASSA